MAGDSQLLTFDSEQVPTEESDIRQYRKQHLAVAFRIFAQLGYQTGPGGHAAVRDPGNPEWFWTNPFGVPFELISASDLILVDSDGALAAGNGLVNRAAFAIHSRVHDARPDVLASVHVHGVAGMAFSALGRPLLPINQDVCAFYQDHEIYDDYDGPALDIADGDAMAKRLGGAKALVLINHGLLTVGSSIDAAAFWMIRMQTCCQVQLLAESTNATLATIPDDVARTTHDVGGTEKWAWFGFQTYYQRVVAQHPEVLD